MQGAPKVLRHPTCSSCYITVLDLECYLSIAHGWLSRYAQLPLGTSRWACLRLDPLNYILSRHIYASSASALCLTLGLPLMRGCDFEQPSTLKRYTGLNAFWPQLVLPLFLATSAQEGTWGIETRSEEQSN